MNILILGNGGRENVLKEKLALTKNDEIFIIDNKNFDDIYNFCLHKNINLVIPSNEEYLCSGIVDFLLEKSTLSNLKVFGPYKSQAKLEGSKLYSKNIMNNLNIPTPICKSILEYPYPSSNNISCLNSLDTGKELVLKYSGLAKGKGVFLPNTHEEFIENLESVKNLGNEGILIEERLHGTEVSVIAFCNGKKAFLMPQAQDFKRKNDNNEGLNTGGMGAISPVNVLSDSEIKSIQIYLDKLVTSFNYKGVLYAGLMKTNENIYFLEFNCRFGDPEAQVLLNLLDYTFNNLKQIILDCIDGKNLNLKWKNDKSIAVVLSHQNYPISKSKELFKINYNGKLDDDIFLYKSNVKTIDNNDYSDGGRVFTIVSVANNFYNSYKKIYNNINKISYQDCFFRKDIGYNYCINEIQYNNISNLAVLASGNGTSIEKLLKDKEQYIKIIITNNRDAKIIEKAKYYNIPFMYFNLGNKESYIKLINILRLFQIKIVLLSGFLKIVPDILFKEFYTINIHPSLLPKYSNKLGDYIHNKCIENKEFTSGCTLHRVNEIVDGGEILLQKQYILKKDENEFSLKQKIQDLENDIIFDFITKINSNQNENSKIEYSININESNELINDIKKINSEIGGFCAEYIYKNIKLAASADGCGSKLDLANKYDLIDDLGIDLVAMNVNDLIAGGAKPLFFMDYIAIDKFDREKCNRLIKSINKGCKIANCKLIGGETAEMQGIYLKDKFDLAGFAIGEVLFECPKKNKINNNCFLYGLESTGVHSNGFTLIRSILEKNNYNVDLEIIKSLLTPTKIYIEIFDILNKCNEIVGISHITGGGFEDNIRRILPDNCDFKLIDWEFPEIFKWIQQKAKLSKKEMLKIFNCGYGMVLITNKKLDLPNVNFIGHIINN